MSLQQAHSFTDVLPPRVFIVLQSQLRMIGNSLEQFIIDFGVECFPFFLRRAPQTRRQFFFDQIVLSDLLHRSFHFAFAGTWHLTPETFQRRFIPKMLRKKLENSVWQPSVSAVTAGTTMRMVRSGSRLPNESRSQNQ